MLLGISSFTYGWSIGSSHEDGIMPINEYGLIEKARQYQLRCLQVGDNLPVHLFDQYRLVNFKQRLQQHHIRIELGARGLTEEKLDHYINLAGYLNAPLLRFVIDEPGYEPYFDFIVSAIKNVLPVLRNKGITLGIENHDRIKAREFADMMNAIDDKQVGICLDCVNSIGAGEGLEHVLSILAPYTVNLHVKDFSIKRLAHQMGFTVTGSPAGQGMLNLATVMGKLLPYNRCQSAILEQWVVPDDTVEGTVFKEHEWANISIKYLKSTKYFLYN